MKTIYLKGDLDLEGPFQTTYFGDWDEDMEDQANEKMWMIFSKTIRIFPSHPMSNRRRQIPPSQGLRP